MSKRYVATAIGALVLSGASILAVAPTASAATPVGACPPSTWDAGQGTGTYWVLSQQEPREEDIGTTTNYDQNGDGYICTLHRATAPRPGLVITDNNFPLQIGG